MMEIKAIAEEINSLISASSNQDALAERIEACFTQVRRTYTQREWPMPAHFVKAMRAVGAGERTQPEPVGFVGETSPEQIMADRMSNGEAVGDSWFYGKAAVTLIRAGLVAPDVLRKYRSAFYFSAKNAGGKDYAGRLEANMIKRHEDAEKMMGESA